MFMKTLRYILLAMLFASPLFASAADSDVTVVYWSAKDCKWCLYWEGSFSGMRQKFEESEEFKKIKFFTIKSERLADQYTQDLFAPEISWVWDRYVANNYKSPGRPSWVIYVGKERAATFYGTKKWDSEAFPFIRDIVAKSDADRLAMIPAK
jgi:hypothetical protein